MAKSAQKRVIGLDGLRGLLAVWVFVFHLLTICGLKVPDVLDGQHAVDAFFVLSGFVVTLVLDTDRLPYRLFLLKRLFRIFPLFAICTTIGAILAEFGVMPDRTDPGTDLAHAIAHLTMLHGIVPDFLLRDSAAAFLNPAWSISVEWQFYLLAPILVHLLDPKRSTAVWLVTLLVAVVVQKASAFLQFDGTQVFGGGTFFGNIGPFILGIISFRAYELVKHSEIQRRKMLVHLVLTVSIVPIFFVSVSNTIGTIIWVITISLVIISLTPKGSSEHSRSAILDWLERRWMVGLGGLSYAIYLIHEPAIWLSLAAWNSFHILADSEIQVRIAFVGIMSAGLSLAAASVLHRWVEIPLIKLGSRIAKSYRIENIESSLR